jgi:peptidoglycan/xylan/chitin deacetylase (PgdA/CDA1 family)
VEPARASYETVVTFHGVGEPPARVAAAERAVWVSEESFLGTLDVAVGGRFRITFDDGNASDLEIALPALLERGLVAEFFIPTARLGRSGYLEAEALRELVDAGMGVGSHGIDHVSWRGLSEAELSAEVEGSRKHLEDVLGGPVTHAACPLGAYDRRVLRALRASGYRRVYTSDGGPARADAWLLPRTTLLRDGSAAEVMALGRAHPSSPAELLRRLKIRLKCLR